MSNFDLSRLIKRHFRILLWHHSIHHLVFESCVVSISRISTPYLPCAKIGIDSSPASYQLKPLGLGAADQADLLSRIRLAQGQDKDLMKWAENNKTEYETSNNGTIVVNGRVCVPANKGLREEILREAHQSKFSIHPGLHKMYHDLKRYYHWVGMKKDVASWVARCSTCQLVKAESQAPSRLVQTLPMPEWKWDHVTMDFVMGLPTSPLKHDAVWVVVDRLTKSAHFLAIEKPMERTYCRKVH